MSEQSALEITTAMSTCDDTNTASQESREQTDAGAIVEEAAGNVTRLDASARRVGGSTRSQRRKDMALVAGIIKGDPDSFEHLHELYRDRIYRFALKRLRDPVEADDVCQDVFLQIYRCIGSYQGRSSLLTWMFGIAHHQVCRRFRRRSYKTLSLDAPEASEVPAEQVPLDRMIDASRVLEDCNRVLDESVNESQREVFHLRYAENLSTRQIAEVVGKSNQAIKISLFRTRKTLAKAAINLDSVVTA